MNTMQEVRIEKLTLNIGAGKDQNKLQKGALLLKRISGREPKKTITQKRIPSWGLRPGLPVGCTITLRKQAVEGILRTLLEAKENTLNSKQFDNNGNMAFGIHEYVEIPGLEYDPAIGNMGLQVCIRFMKPGKRIQIRKQQKKRLPTKQRVSQEEAIQFMKQHYNLQVNS